MENKQTAINWLKEKIFELEIKIDSKAHEETFFLFEQAKAMEKEQEFETKLYWFGKGVLAGRENRIKELKPKRN